MAVIVPTTQDRMNVFNTFMDAWHDLLNKHNAKVLIIFDGDKQHLLTGEGEEVTAESLLGDDADLIYSHDTACKNLGLAYCAKHPEIDRIIILDDDVRPTGDPIQDHLDVLGKPVATSWFSTASEYMRGFPYGIRNEAEVALSHGVWTGVPDFDAPTQLIKGVHDVYFPKAIIPKGTLFPMCGMNLGLTRKALPYLYFAPPWHEMSRCDDIFGGIMLKRAFDDNGLAVATGYATVNHERASNVFSNLHKEGLFIKLNETFFKGDISHPYFSEYLPKYHRWNVMFGNFN